MSRKLQAPTALPTGNPPPLVMAPNQERTFETE